MNNMVRSCETLKIGFGIIKKNFIFKFNKGMFDIIFKLKCSSFRADLLHLIYVGRVFQMSEHTKQN